MVSGAPTSIATGYPKQLNLTSTTGWDGVDNVPVMQTVDGVTYAYVPALLPEQLSENTFVQVFN